MQTRKVRRLGNSNIVALPRHLEWHGFGVGAEIVIVCRDDGSLLLAPTALAAAPPALLDKALQSLPTPTSLVVREMLRRRRRAILRATFAAGAERPRVIGPVATGTARVGGGVTFLVRRQPRMSGRGRGDWIEPLRQALEKALDLPVTVVDEAGLRGARRSRLLSQSIAL